MFAAVPSPVLGLQLDPSHCVFLDKDTEIDRAKRARHGTFGQAIGTVPGLGHAFLSRLIPPTDGTDLLPG